ncbi:MAG: flavodoxin [Caldiserica bacterium]|nr:flavodoxin [Caldisericota bacterium]
MAAIVYYSRTGSTREHAKCLREITGGELIELEEIKARKTSGQCAIQALLGICSALKNADFDLSPFETIILMTPIYAWNPSPALNTFLKKADLRGKKVYLVTLGEDPNSHKKPIEKIKAKVEKKGGIFLGASSFKGANMFKGTFRFTEEELKRNCQEIAKKIA